MDYLRLGTLRLTMMDGVNGFEEKGGFNFATQERCSGQPGLQAIGETLSQITLYVSLRSAMGHNIPEMLKQIDDLRRSGMPQLLVFADGVYKGNYVITERSTTITRTTSTGSIMEADIAISLLEYVERTVVNTLYIELMSASEISNRIIGTK